TATPLLFSVPVPSDVVPSKKVTVPVGVAVAPPPAVTVAVRVSPPMGIGCTVSTVVVGAWLTVVLAVAVLFAEFESPAVVGGGAVALAEPVAFGGTTTVTVTGVPLVTVPRLAVTTPPACVTVPALELADWKVRPAGSVRVRTVPVAALAVLRLVTVAVK